MTSSTVMIDFSLKRKQYGLTIPFFVRHEGLRFEIVKLDTEIACGNDLIFCLSVRVFFDGIHFVKRREIFDRFFRRRRRRDVDDIHVGCFWQSRRCQIVLEIGDVDVCVVGQSIVLQLSINQDLQIFFYSHCRICIFATVCCLDLGTSQLGKFAPNLNFRRANLRYYIC